jgi:hypothetical protein
MKPEARREPSECHSHIRSGYLSVTWFFPRARKDYVHVMLPASRASKKLHWRHGMHQPWTGRSTPFPGNIHMYVV